jgi:hypothetical protein
VPSISVSKLTQHSQCMGLWSEHGTSWYNCNRFEEKSGTDARDSQAKSRQSLERYLHYYNRYANHEQSAKLDKDIYHKTEKKMTLLQSSSNMSWIEVQFLETASKALQQCRQTLKWTYAFAYYLARNNQTEIFEDNQKDLEMAVENLSEVHFLILLDYSCSRLTRMQMFEKQPDQLASLKVQMMDKTAYCTQRHIILLDDTAKNLKEGMSIPVSGLYIICIANKISQKIGSLTRLSLEPTTLLAFLQSIYDPTHKYFLTTTSNGAWACEGWDLLGVVSLMFVFLGTAMRFVSGFSLALGILFLDGTILSHGCDAITRMLTEVERVCVITSEELQYDYL